MILLNPKQFVDNTADDKTREVFCKTIEFFETKGRRRIKEDERNHIWYADFLTFVKENKIFSTLLTPTGYGPKDARWDTSRIATFNEILGFYGLPYWYTWQVSILGLGPIWMSRNEELKRKAAKLLDEGAIFAFGLSEKEHGADLYSTEMKLVPQPEGGYLASGKKYYIGNGNEAQMVSVFGKIEGTGEYVFFVANYAHEKYECVGNVCASQNYVAEFVLHDYPITERDILSRGDEAWDAALNTVNIGKYNLGWVSVGMCEHAFYEAVNHAANRKLYGMHVIDFPHVKRMFTDAYARLVAAKLFARRAADYMRVASPEDRRYLLYNPVVKMKVTTQCEEVINLMWDVIAAKGFEKDMYFEMVTRDVRCLPKLEGTVHVNIALIVKFMANYFFHPAPFDPIGPQTDAKNDDFLFRQGSTKGLAQIRFHDYATVYDTWNTPNVRIFSDQINVLKTLLATATPEEAQQKDIDFLLSLGELFTLVVYGQLILENATLSGVDEDHVDQIFDFMVRDFSRHALEVHDKPSSTPRQMELCLKMLRKPAFDAARYERVSKQVHAFKDAYVMNE